MIADAFLADHSWLITILARTDAFEALSAQKHARGRLAGPRAFTEEVGGGKGETTSLQPDQADQGLARL